MANSTEVNYGFGQMGSIHAAGTEAITIIGGLDSDGTPAGNTNRTTKVFVAITFLEDTVFDSGTDGLVPQEAQNFPSSNGNSTDIDADGGDVVDSETFPKGVTIYGRWTGFKLAAKWDDSSGNNNHATQSVEANQADVSGGGLDFEQGDSDHYDLASTITIAENQGFCVAIVMDTETSSNNFIFSKESTDQIQIESNSTFTIKTNDPGNITTKIVAASGTFGNQKQLILVNRSAGASNRFSVFKDGSAVTIDTDNSSNEAAGENPNGFDINVLGSKAGAEQYFDGIMFEVLFFDKGLSSTEISNLNAYLTSKHGL